VLGKGLRERVLVGGVRLLDVFVGQQGAWGDADAESRERVDLLRVLGTEVFSTGADSETGAGDRKS